MSVLVHRRNDPESILRVVCVLVLDAPQRVKHVPACTDHQFQCALLFAVFQLVQVGIVLVVQTFNIQAFFQVLNQVIAVQNAALADFNSTSQRTADGATGQGWETLLSVQVNAFVLCALVHKLNVREDFAPVVSNRVGDDGQHFTVETISQLVGMSAHNRCNVRAIAHQPCYKKYTESAVMGRNQPLASAVHATLDLNAVALLRLDALKTAECNTARFGELF